ncbi:MAG: transcription-repair coupling factor [Armatimonadota bacterium]
MVELLGTTGGFQRAREALDNADTLCIQGVSGGGKSTFCGALLEDIDTPCVILTYNAERAKQLVSDLSNLLNDGDANRLKRRVLQLPSTASALYDGVTPPPETIADRMLVLERLCAGDPVIVVASITAVLTLTIPGAHFIDARVELQAGQEIDRNELGARLETLGYEHVDLIDDVGQYSIRGGIVDVAPPALDFPVRVEFFGDEIESLRLFDPVSQRSIREIERIGVGTAGEVLLKKDIVQRALPEIELAYRRELDRLNERQKTREVEKLKERMGEDLRDLQDLHPSHSLVHYLPYLYDVRETAMSYLPADAPVIMDEPVRTKAAAEQFEKDVRDAHKRGAKLGRHLRLPETACLTFDEFRGQFLTASRPQIFLNMLKREVPWDSDAPVCVLSTPPTATFGGRFELLVEGLAEWQKEGRCIVVCAGDAERTAEVLDKRGLQNVRVGAGTEDLRLDAVNCLPCELSSGFDMPDAGIVVITGKEIYGWRKLHRPESSSYRRGFSLVNLRELNEDDYVVHINHGIGVYRGLSKQTVDGMERDYIVVDYAGEDRVYVPVTQLDRLQKYVGPEGGKVKVNSLKGGSWQKTKKKASKSAQLLARELMKLYSEREQADGFAFDEDTPWLKELEQSFKFEETRDQLQAIEDVKQDMEAETPADRLICGDVGFGKTEVAIRAAFKAVLNGKQVAILVPTTILAHQHYNTFRERLSRYPIEVEMLSRFRTTEQQRAITGRLKDGSVDVVIGTHRLLGSDIGFDDLGLLIVDEEQRFGVRQKERLKKLRTSVDVITLTATPIPRTLNMALSGIREISLINDPPPGRRAIRTFVRERDDALIAEAIRREIERGGQVYFVHNRVQSISHIAAGVQRLVPEAKVAVAHGQMDEEDLEEVMMAFYAEEFDVLVCTTIIENGLDVATANTLIVDDADKMGLSQLYQLRGRVGRSTRQAYAYLLYKYPERMTEDAEERLKAIEEFSELGSGFKIALRDLEIRGAGDILGKEQSGHMSAVGLDLYCQMLADAVSTLKGENGESSKSVSVDLPLEAVVPAAYVPGERQRIDLYRRLANVADTDELKEIVAEMNDRYGKPPRPVRNLVTIARIKLKCKHAGVTDIMSTRKEVTVRLADKYRLSREELRLLEGVYVPSRRQARKGAKSPLPRAVFRRQQITFGYSRRDPQLIIPALNDLLQRLIDRRETPNKWENVQTERSSAAR